ncbi:hypothetical protein Taro_026318 [Colocasia esculenta]|uniref:Uncharacterized protein n=1 Tax=Colocasia esculenta TaxID=4460 RepID=A0A843V5X2_COLES|nr:hypothetical protein [Colocasia esculenta]
MRFLEYVPCGRKSNRRKHQGTPRRAAEAAAAAVVTNLLPRTTADGGAPSQERRRSGSTAASHWRPALGAISEGGVFHATKEKGGRLRSSAGKGKGAPERSSCHRDYRDDHRNLTAPAVLPPFDPTAYLF